MKIVYFSKTGNIKRFVRKLDFEATRADESLIMDQAYILIMYTTGIGQVPKEISRFLNHPPNSLHLKGLVCSGNKNWGINYCKAAYIIAAERNVPILQTFELSGNIHDVTKFNQVYEESKNEQRI